jgi:hypothetical protein
MPNAVPRIQRSRTPNDVSLVVRGDELDERTLRADAVRFHRRFADWDRYGISALLARDESEIDALCETRLERFPVVDGNIVRVRTRPGPVSKHRQLLGGRVA